MELWDALDAAGNRLGFDLVRGEPVPAGCFHTVVEVAVVHRDGSVLITRRDLKKATWPGAWELGAGGSVLKGESWEDGARRELFEETGIEAAELTPLFVLTREETGALYAGYLCRYAGEKTAVRLQPGETIDYRWLAPDELRAFAGAPDFVSGHRERWRKYIQHAFAE